MAFVRSAIVVMVGSASAALDILNELVTALGNDPSSATVITNSLAGRQPKDTTSTALTGSSTSKDRFPYFTGEDRAALTALTNVGCAILSKPSAQGVFDYLGLGNGSTLPIGAPVPWPFATPSIDWSKCNGAAFSAEGYPKLTEVHLTNKLPDLRDEFTHGQDDSRGIDTGRSLPSGQAATFTRTVLQSYHGCDLNTDVKVDIAFTTVDSVITVGNPADPKAGDNGDYVPVSADNSVVGIQRTAEGNSTGAWMSIRPRNLSFNYIMRAA